MTFFQTLETIGLPCVYSHYEQGREDIGIPYLAYHGNGQETFSADDTFYWRYNTYMVEYYFIEKDESKEEEIENALLSNGYRYSKSDDVYIESEGVFVIYYTVGG